MARSTAPLPTLPADARSLSPSAAPSLTPAEFAHKWQGVTTTERASAQAQFIDICRLLGEPTPHDADPTGEVVTASPMSGSAATSPGSTRASART